MQTVWTGEVDIPTVHYVDGTGLWHERIERMHIVKLSIGNMNKTRDVAA